jgi:hypothetical protein
MQNERPLEDLDESATLPEGVFTSDLLSDADMPQLSHGEPDHFLAKAYAWTRSRIGRFVVVVILALTGFGLLGAEYLYPRGDITDLPTMPWVHAAIGAVAAGICAFLGWMSRILLLRRDINPPRPRTIDRSSAPPKRRPVAVTVSDIPDPAAAPVKAGVKAL